MRKWTELHCTGSIPSPRASHAAALVDNVMYVFGGYSSGEGTLDGLYALQLSSERLSKLDHYVVHMRNAAQRWFKFHNVGRSPQGRLAHTMASDGTRVFVLGGYLSGTRANDMSLIHVFDTSMYFHSLISSVQPPRSSTQRT